MAYHNGYAGGYGPNHARHVGQFYRLGTTRLHLVPIGRSIPQAFPPGAESWERVSDRFVYYDGADSGFNDDDVMSVVASAWSTHAGSSAATLKAAINQALADAAYGAPDGSALT